MKWITGVLSLGTIAFGVYMIVQLFNPELILGTTDHLIANIIAIAAPLVGVGLGALSVHLFLD